MNRSTPGLPVHHQLQLKLMSIESVTPSSHLILCRPLLLLPLIPPSIRVFSNESTLRISGSKFSKPGFSNTWAVNFQMFKLVLEMAEEPEIKMSTSAGSSKKQESRKTSMSALLTMTKPLTVWITINWGKFSRDWNIRPPDLPPEKSGSRSRSNS